MCIRDSTVIGQIIAAGLAIFFNIKKNTEISINLKGFRPSGQIIKKIYAVGVPSIICLLYTSYSMARFRNKLTSGMVVWILLSQMVPGIIMVVPIRCV